MSKLLIVEDDPLVSRMYKKIFGFEGFDVETAVDGKVGLQKARTLKPELVLLDVMMPAMNGFEVLEKMKADPELRDVPVIVLSNLSGTYDAKKALDMGAIAYMVKSEYKPKEVAMRVKGYLTDSKAPQPQS